MTRRWAPIRRELLNGLLIERARLLSAAMTDEGGKDPGDVALASLRKEEATLTRSRTCERIDAITRALARLDAGTYGLCVDCSGEIATARLIVLPTVERCVKCQVEIERESNDLAR